MLLDHALDTLERKGPIRDIGTTHGEHYHVGLHQDFRLMSGNNTEDQVDSPIALGQMMVYYLTYVNSSPKFTSSDRCSVESERTSSLPSRQ
jgi:hypothetical protein